MPSPRIPHRSAKPDSPRFAETFARRPGLPRITRLPDRRAWGVTAAVVVLVGGVAVAVPALAGGGQDPVDTSEVASGPTNRPSATPTSSPSRTPSVTAVPETTVTASARRSATVTLPPATVTVRRPTATVTTTATTTVKTSQPTGEPLAAGTAGREAAAQSTITRKSVTPQGVMIQGVGSNRCIEVRGAQDGVGRSSTPLQLWDCNGKVNQQWAFHPDGTIRSLGLCMDLAWASTAEGTQIRLVTCNGGWAQKFSLNEAHDLVVPKAGKCVAADSPGNGGALSLRTCNGGTAQKWRKH